MFIAAFWSPHWIWFDIGLVEMEVIQKPPSSRNSDYTTRYISPIWETSEKVSALLFRAGQKNTRHRYDITRYYIFTKQSSLIVMIEYDTTHRWDLEKYSHLPSRRRQEFLVQAKTHVHVLHRTWLLPRQCPTRYFVLHILLTLAVVRVPVLCVHRHPRTTRLNPRR